jgi:2'-5' RNA ligase
VAQRLFVSVELSAELRDGLAAALAALHGPVQLPAGVRVLAADTWHLTLQFLGSVRDEQIEDVKAACAAAANEHAPFEFELGGAGAFPATRSAHVVWAGLWRGETELASVARSLEQKLAPVGFTPEEREFSAHVTLARVKPRADVRRMVAALDVPRRAMIVSELTLFRSHLSSEGARHEPIGRFALSRAPEC